MNTWDEAKRQATLRERGLDFADAEEIFAGDFVTREDLRRDYGERRYITGGWLKGRFVILVWTSRPEGRRIISLRHGHGQEEARYRQYMD